MLYLKRKIFILNINKIPTSSQKTKQFDMKTILQDEILFKLYSMDRRMNNSTIFSFKIKEYFWAILNAISWNQKLLKIFNMHGTETYGFFAPWPKNLPLKYFLKCWEIIYLKKKYQWFQTRFRHLNVCVLLLTRLRINMPLLRTWSVA